MQGEIDDVEEKLSKNQSVMEKLEVTDSSRARALLRAALQCVVCLCGGCF